MRGETATLATCQFCGGGRRTSGGREMDELGSSYRHGDVRRAAEQRKARQRLLGPGTAGTRGDGNEGGYERLRRSRGWRLGFTDGCRTRDWMVQAPSCSGDSRWMGWMAGCGLQRTLQRTCRRLRGGGFGSAERELWQGACRDLGAGRVALDSGVGCRVA